MQQQKSGRSKSIKVADPLSDTETFVNDVFAAIQAKSYLSVNSTVSGAAVGSISTASPPQQLPSAPLPLSPQAQSQPQPQPQLQRTPEAAPAAIDEDEDMDEYKPDRASIPPTFNPAAPSFTPQEPERGQKRSYYDRDRDPSYDNQSSTSSRSFKAPRRGYERGGANGGRWAGRGNMGMGRGGPIRDDRDLSTSPLFKSPTTTGLLPGMPGFVWPEDPNLTAMMAMQAAGLLSATFPVVPPVADAGSPPPRKPVERKVGERCKDYDQMGYCMKGDMCPYEHGNDPIVVKEEGGDEYDPNNSQLFNLGNVNGAGAFNNRNSSRGGNDRGRGRGRGRGGPHQGGRGGRSDISGQGPNFDRSNSTLVVEHIPEDKMNEEAIREFFSAFGNITEINLQQHRRLATVKFERWDMARKAYDSPAPIFDNRFVKVFWYRPDNTGAIPGRPTNSAAPVPAPVGRYGEEMEVDMDEFKRKAEEAQKAHEAKMARKKAHEEALKELERKKEELLKMEQEQKRILMEKLAKRKAQAGTTGTMDATPSPATPATPVADEKMMSPGTASTSAQKSAKDAETERLRAQLEALEAEAKSLGIESQEQQYSPFPYRGRGRGRGAYRGAGRGFSPYVPPGAGTPYGGYRGRGGSVSVRGGAMRLDNRPKKVAVGGLDAPEKEEGLKQYLLVGCAKTFAKTFTDILYQTIGEFESITPHPDKPNTVIVAFKDRITAEMASFT